MIITSSGKRFSMYHTYFIRNLHNQKLQHYAIGKIPTLVQNTITLAQKKNAELKIIEGLHNHDSGHKINNIYTKHNDKPANIGPWHACNSPHLIKICNEFNMWQMYAKPR